MPSHNDYVVYIRFQRPGDDLRSPSKFVEAAMKIRGVREAFRILGRYDAFVRIHSEEASPGQNDAVLIQIQKLPNVAAVDTLVGYPTGHEKPAVLPPPTVRLQ